VISIFVRFIRVLKSERNQSPVDLKPELFSDLNIKHFGLALIFTAGYGIIVFVLYRYFNYIY